MFRRRPTGINGAVVRRPRRQSTRQREVPQRRGMAPIGIASKGCSLNELLEVHLEIASPGNAVAKGDPYNSLVTIHYDIGRNVFAGI